MHQIIWSKDVTVEALNSLTQLHMGSHLGIQITELGNDFLCGTMPVDNRTKQPFGILHGGASCVLAETLGSVAANSCIDTKIFMAVGLSITASHIRSVSSGQVKGTARPVHIGRSTQVWSIEIQDEQGRLVCLSQLTTMIKKREQK